MTDRGAALVFLHSTGQLHKGGPPIGHFLQITERPDQDVPVPGMPYAFGQLEAAQAEGDLRALRARGRPAVRIDGLDRKSTRLNSSHTVISYAVFCLKKKNIRR